ncbi:hypothetical protein [Solitalea longa]|uniref:hypothetical protein n=1 Tax=Solitalea longa TaxID=2079460 RepID=UPI0013FE3988|nr:hypothetical protein [Solitalea longa]
MDGAEERGARNEAAASTERAAMTNEEPKAMGMTACRLAPEGYKVLMLIVTL